MIRLRQKRKRVLTVVVIMSILLYLAGVYSGLYASKIIEAKTKQEIIGLKNDTAKDISQIKELTSKEVSNLASYINFLDNNLRTLQLERIFADTLDRREMCRFSSISMTHLMDELQGFRNVLPFRIEEYERNNVLDEKYLKLKGQYNQLSISTWVMARNIQKKCNSTLVQGLYFYSKDCDTCVKQGEELDKFTSTLMSLGKNVMLFTIDYDSKLPMIEYIKELYGINSTPALLIEDKPYIGRVYSSDEILRDIK